MRKIVECVPNFSEGRRPEVVDALVAALRVPGVVLLDREMDAAHNRCVITVAGDPEAVRDGVLAAVGLAVQLIDLRQHTGEHPRMGATDVVPFVPISGLTIEDCVALAVEVGAETARRYGIPVYLYERAARLPARQDLAYVRKGEFEGLREEIRVNAERKPDFGPSEVHPSAGATAVGARTPLIAYNVYLGTTELRIAQEVARAVRFSSGGLRFVKALGFEIRDRNQVQVSMNLTDYEKSSVHQAFEMVRREAERYGVPVLSSEIVGLVPQKALDACAAWYLRLEKFSGSQVLECRLAESLSGEPTVGEFTAAVASSNAVPGGGSVAAHGGAIAAALGEMLAGLTEGKKKYQPVWTQAAELRRKLKASRMRLQELVRADASAYEAVVAAMKLPKETEADRALRAEAIQTATRAATETPLRTAREAAVVLESLESLLRIGNVNARSDGASAAQFAFAALKAAQYNVVINLPGLSDREYAAGCRAEVESLVRSAGEALQRIDLAMTAES